MTGNLRRMVYSYPLTALGIVVRVVVENFFYSWFFYRSFWPVILLVIPGFFRFRFLCNDNLSRKQKELEEQFRECIMSVATGLRAGYSLENAFRESIGDMRTMFGEKSRIVKELWRIYGGLKNNISLEDMLNRFGEESGSVLIKEFADVLNVTSKNGGDLTEVIENTAECMEEQNRVIREMEDIISGRKLEGRIMSLIPFLLVFFVQSTNRGYFDLFYHNTFGITVMSISLLVYLLATFLIEKILDIAK